MEARHLMFSLDAFLLSLAIVVCTAVLLWIVSIIIEDVSIVDSFWSLMILLAGIGFMIEATPSSFSELDSRQLIVSCLLTLWALRLSIHIAVRNHGKEEDERYQQIRRNNQPNFEFKSLYIVFLLQALLSVIVALPLLSVFHTSTPVNIIDYIAFALWCTGMLFEAVSDYQLSKFKRSPVNKSSILNTGLWRYSRHPNYFGEFCIWWSCYLFAAATGHYWSIISPLLMTVLLLKISGVGLMESTITERRPGYAQYIRTTNAFFPWLPSDQTKAGKSS
jgi:steroid 5-alpha reductase family enzyme